MARKRMIDPELWRDRKVIKLDTKALVIWMGCITTADDEGILEPDPHSFYFELGRGDVSVEEISNALDTLEKHRMIRRYGDCYAFIPSWFKHQKLDKPRPTKRPRPPKTLVEEYPDYIQGWQETFSTKSEAASYPFETCLQEPESNDDCGREESTTIRRRVDDDSSKSRRPFDSNGMEWNGMEWNGKNASAEPSGSDDGALPSTDLGTELKHDVSPHVLSAETETDLFNAVQRDFLIRQPGQRFTNFGKEGKAIKQLISKARERAPDAPNKLLAAQISAFRGLKRNGTKGLKEKPDLPSALNTEWVWDTVLEKVKRQVQSRQPSEDEDVEIPL